MKKKLKLVQIFSFFTLLLFMSCQDEVIEITEPTESEAIVAGSELSDLMEAIATFDGSADNIIDNASCLSIELPVIVIVNNLEISIDSEEDYAVVEDIFDEFDDDDDSLEIIFPITIILSDFSEVEIDNQNDLNGFIEDCTPEGEEDGDIECIDFIYPFNVSVFNVEFDVIDVLTIENDRQLFQLIGQIRDDLIVSINYPISLITSDGITVQVNNNAELVNTIRAAIGECDEDDDNDFNDDGFENQNEEIISFLSECLWRVDELSVGGDNFERNFIGMPLNFNNDNSVGIRSADQSGIYTVTDDSATGIITFQINLDQQGVRPNLQLEWTVISATESLIILESASSGEMILRRHCSQDDNLVPLLEEIVETVETIGTNEWIVTLYEVGNDDMTNNYLNYTINFASVTGRVIVRDPNNEIVQTSGSWFIYVNQNDDLFFDFNFGEQEPLFFELMESWQVDQFDQGRVELIDFDENGDAERTLVIERK